MTWPLLLARCIEVGSCGKRLDCAIQVHTTGNSLLICLYKYSIKQCEKLKLPSAVPIVVMFAEKISYALEMLQWCCRNTPEGGK